MNQYETVIVLTPVLSDDEAKRSLDVYKEMLTGLGAEMVHEERWGLKQLAYPIKKKTTGIYFVIEYKADANVVAKLELQRTSPPTKKAHKNRSGCGWSSQSAIGGAIDRAKQCWTAA